MLFISHANPEDNEFARWLALRLAAEGYPVWCDLTELLGGERFWTDIEDAIRSRTVKFLFVLSRSSNHKIGPLNELDLALATQRAHGLSDFVIPLWIDDLPSLDFNIRLGGINAVPFNDGWAAGLGRLLKKLDQANVPCDPRFNPDAVGAWWAKNVSASQGLSNTAEHLSTNVFPIHETSLYLYRSDGGTELGRLGPAIPFESSHDLVASFAPPSTLSEIGASLEMSEIINVGDTGLPPPPQGWNHGDLRRTVTGLLNQHWRIHLQRSGLQLYQFSGGQLATYFTLADRGLERVTFQPPFDGETKSWRQLMGYRTMPGPKDEPPRLRYWHFALEARANSDLCVGFVMKPHVLFSDDGLTVWDDDDRLHRARRSQCKGWWNDKWRDLTLAALAAMASQTDRIDIGGECGASLQMSTIPIMLTAPVSYEEPCQERPIGGALDIDDELHEDNDEDDWY